jgi:hypothetical protein
VFLGGGRFSVDSLLHVEERLARKKKTAAAAAVVASHS